MIHVLIPSPPVLHKGLNGTVAPLGSTIADCAAGAPWNPASRLYRPLTAAPCSRPGLCAAINSTRTAVANYRRSSACATLPAAGSAALSGRQGAPTRQCPSNCNNHGSCDYTTFSCYCRLPWYNSATQLDCSLKKCPNDW